MANIKTISQKTGAFIGDDASEPGFTVNMDNDEATDFIAKVKADAKGDAASTPAPAVVEVEVRAPSTFKARK